MRNEPSLTAMSYGNSPRPELVPIRKATNAIYIIDGENGQHFLGHALIEGHQAGLMLQLCGSDALQAVHATNAKQVHAQSIHCHKDAPRYNGTVMRRNGM